QAEDGIRDYKVTGVQTCALPLCSSSSSSPLPDSGRMNALRRRGGTAECAPLTERQMMSLSSPSGARSSIEKSMAAERAAPNALRSEERRVGRAGGGRVVVWGGTR